MARGCRRKCKCCRELFRPDPCNRRHQRYFSAPRCRRASKAASQARWLSKPGNEAYEAVRWLDGKIHGGSLGPFYYPE
jgi:hypothetical protein